MPLRSRLARGFMFVGTIVLIAAVVLWMRGERDGMPALASTALLFLASGALLRVSARTERGVSV